MDLDQIIEKLDIETYVESLGLTFAKKDARTNWYLTECPFCQGKKKFSICISGPKKSVWGCYKCREKGNAVTLYSKLKNTGNGEAVKYIKETLGIEDEKVVKVPPKARTQDKKNDTEGENVPLPEPPPEEEGEDAGSEGSSPADIYERFITLASLTPEHRESLKKKRGFSETTIDQLRFRSAGAHVPDVISELRKEFADQDLQEAAILVDVNGTLCYNQQLLDDNIIIPFLDTQGKVYHLRPHKLGFRGVQIRPYCRFLLAEKTEEVVITEGEFKAAALCQWDIPAIGLPGTSSFAGKYFDRLVEILREFSVKRITIIFDNEVKDDPKFSNYKEKPELRHDTDFWTYVMARKLGQKGFIVRAAKLPGEWREDGKIDFDMALAQGKTREDILKVMARGKTAKEFLDNLTDDAKRVVQRKAAKHFTKIPVKREFNKYVVSRVRNGEWEEYTISNFVINIKSSFFTAEGVIRNVQLVNEYGERSDIFPLVPGEMAGLNEFKKFVFGKGNYVFEGETKDLLNVWKREFLRDIGELIYQPDRIGYVEKEDLWLFANLAMKSGKEYEPDNDGIIWVNNKGFKPQSLQIGSRGEAIEDAIPSLNRGEKEKDKVDLVELSQKIKQTVGGYEAYMGIGWVIATIFSKDIFAKYKCMPILFPHGKRESGKTTFMRWMMAMFGIETEGAGIAETTQNFIARSMSFYSSLGCWFDEYRNEIKVKQKDGFFRSAYNRQFSGKGTTSAFQAKGFSVHASVAISGEEMPGDNGLFTRLIPLQMSSYRRDRTHYDWLNRNMGTFSYMTYYLIKNYETLKPKIMRTTRDMKEALLERDVSDRTAENWAICAGAFDAVILQDDAFIKWVDKTCQEIKQTGESEHMLNQFWNDISYLLASEQLNGEFLRADGNELSLNFNGVYQVWAKHYRSKTGQQPFDEHSIKKYLCDEPYYIGAMRKYFGKSEHRRRAVVVDVLQGNEPIKEIAEYLGTPFDDERCEY